jgi:hypothetical protein
MIAFQVALLVLILFALATVIEALNETRDRRKR